MLTAFNITTQILLLWNQMLEEKQNVKCAPKHKQAFLSNQTKC